MTDQLISFETAKSAKEKGFSNGSTSYWNGILDLQTYDPKFHPNVVHTNNIMQRFRYEAPTQSLLQKWLREEHKIDIIIHVTSTTNEYWAHIPNFIRGDWKSICFKIYEEALEQGLQQALKLIP